MANSNDRYNSQEKKDHSVLSVAGLNGSDFRSPLSFLTSYRGQFFFSGGFFCAEDERNDESKKAIVSRAKLDGRVSGQYTIRCSFCVCGCLPAVFRFRDIPLSVIQSLWTGAHQTRRSSFPLLYPLSVSRLSLLWRCLSLVFIAIKCYNKGNTWVKGTQPWICSYR